MLVVRGSGRDERERGEQDEVKSPNNTDGEPREQPRLLIGCFSVSGKTQFPGSVTSMFLSVSSLPVPIGEKEQTFRSVIPGVNGLEIPEYGNQYIGSTNIYIMIHAGPH